MFGAWGLVSRNPTGSGTAWYAFDQRGNVAQRVSGSGALLSTDVYDSYGKKRSGPADVFGFGGQAGYYTDAETGLILCTNRHYDPQQGRFLTRDPLGYGGGINLYSYTANNPVSRMDPDGTFWFLITGAIGAVGGGIIGGATAYYNGQDVWAGAGKGALIGGVVGLTGGLAGGLVAGAVGGGVVGGILGGAAGGAIGDAAGQGTELGLGWRQHYDPYQTAFAGTLGAAAGGFVWRPTNAPMQTVTHWGNPSDLANGLQDGNWVQLGGRNPLNRGLSGIMRRYPYGASITTNVPGSTLHYPSGLESCKGLFGQRVYKP